MSACRSPPFRKRKAPRSICNGIIICPALLARHVKMSACSATTSDLLSILSYSFYVQAGSSSPSNISPDSSMMSHICISVCPI